MTYDEAMKYIKETDKLGSVPGLDSITMLLERLSNPQDKLRIIHVAGTNGKGSTISFLSSILGESGYKVGIYTSPVVFSYREKIQVIWSNAKQSKYISKDDVGRMLGIIKSACDHMVIEGFDHPTSFEIETAMALFYFLSENVDYVILEAGMGGRQDATNVVKKPVCSVVTSISMDHMQYLGDTLEEVATEKSGIIKKGCPVIVSDQKPEVINILEKKAREMNVPLVVADTRKVKDISFSLDKTCFSYPIDGEYREYQISLLGKHQIQNAVLAIEVARELGKLNIVSKSNPSIYSHSFSNNISEDSIGEGLYKARWHGRFEQISKNPDIYIDGAHNEEAALRLRDSIEIYFTNRRIIFMIGVLADKDYQSMLEILAPLAYTIITLTPDNNRGLSSHILASEARKYCDRVLDGGDLKHAIKLVYKEAKSDDIIIAFGSLSFLGSLAGDLNTKG